MCQKILKKRQSNRKKRQREGGGLNEDLMDVQADYEITSPTMQDQDADSDDEEGFMQLSTLEFENALNRKASQEYF